MMDLKNKRIAVFGMGVSGISALRLLKWLGVNIIAINSGDVHTWAKNPGVLEFVSLNQCYAENELTLVEELATVDLVILSPGIPRDHSLLLPLIKKGVAVYGELELAFRTLESQHKLKPIIGITGTNGKTTTTTFLGEMIKADHKKVFVGGNIGVPFCDYAMDVLAGKEEVDYILLELSSFQLESIDHFHVNIALFLNLYQNHGERYHSIEDYGRSKFLITNRFTKDDLLIYPSDFPFVAHWAQGQVGRKQSVNTASPEASYKLDHFKLPGIHNRVNLNFILLVAQELQLNPKAIQKCIDTFPGVHHRIEYVETSLGFKVYNDAKSTNWDATLTAVKAMEDMLGPLYLIIGGKKRGHGDSILPYLDFFKARVECLYLIGEMAHEIEAEVKGKMTYKTTLTLEKTIEDLRKIGGDQKGVLLFSPGFPSFDQFRNYAHRGEHFVSLLQKSINE